MAHNQPSEYPSQGSASGSRSYLDPEEAERMSGRTWLSERGNAVLQLNCHVLPFSERKRKKMVCYSVWVRFCCSNKYH